MRRRKAFEWRTRSRSRWNTVRSSSGGSGRARPRERALLVAWDGRSCSSHASVRSRGIIAFALARPDGAIAAQPLTVALGPCLLLLQGRLRGRQPGRRHPVRRAADVGQADLVAELDAGGIAPMLAADAELDVGAGLPPEPDGHVHQTPNAPGVQHLERVLGQDLLVHIPEEELALGVIAAEPVDQLRQVVAAEGEEFRELGDL